MMTQLLSHHTDTNMTLTWYRETLQWGQRIGSPLPQSGVRNEERRTACGHRLDAEHLRPRGASSEAQWYLRWTNGTHPRTQRLLQGECPQVYLSTDFLPFYLLTHTLHLIKRFLALFFQHVMWYDFIWPTGCCKRGLQTSSYSIQCCWSSTSLWSTSRGQHCGRGGSSYAHCRRGSDLHVLRTGDKYTSSFHPLLLDYTRFDTILS